MGRVKAKLDALATMPATDLRTEWERLFATETPNLPEKLLRMALSYRIQEKAAGGLPAVIQRELKRGQGNQTEAIRPAVVIRPGTRLVRSWNGRTIEVLATENGFEFEECSYRSLSAIARTVTGAAWSGPRFFGLTGRA